MTNTPTHGEMFAEAGLFEVEAPPPVSLADKFGIPPMSVLDRRTGEWQNRKRKWLSLGMESEVGRDVSSGAVASMVTGDGFLAQLLRGDTPGMTPIKAEGVSIFDPVLCELVYRWHTPEGARVLDPFAGGSVRGIVASTLARWYDGIELRAEQVEANDAQAHLGSDIAPRWIEGDSSRIRDHVGGGYDLLFSCPPYADLEVYSDDPRDLSAMHYEDFIDSYRAIIRDSLSLLRPDRFAAWVISDVRDKRGAYRGLVADTIRAFTDAGATLHNDGRRVGPDRCCSSPRRTTIRRHPQAHARPPTPPNIRQGRRQTGHDLRQGCPVKRGPFPALSQQVERA